jgi:hypothetical protein
MTCSQHRLAIPYLVDRVPLRRVDYDRIDTHFGQRADALLIGLAGAHGCGHAKFLLRVEGRLWEGAAANVSVDERRERKRHKLTDRQRQREKRKREAAIRHLFLISLREMRATSSSLSFTMGSFPRLLSRSVSYASSRVTPGGR